MDEALKTNRLRNPEFFNLYLRGKIIDIGAGRDPVCPTAERFDMEEGDANFITRYRAKGSYDSVHSSHCLEHMNDPRHALSEWWSLIKPGGYLILVVPDEDLYEQGFWPSRFNSEHKHTFRLGKKQSWSPVSYDIVKLVEDLPGAKIISAELQHQNYDFTLQSSHPPKFAGEPFHFKVFKVLARFLVFGKARGRIRRRLEDYSHRNYHRPIDQTMREALAQIQVVAQKRRD